MKQLAEFVLWASVVIAWGCVSGPPLETPDPRPPFDAAVARVHPVRPGLDWTRTDSCHVSAAAPEWARSMRTGSLVRPIRDGRVVVYSTCDCVPGDDVVILSDGTREESYAVERRCP